MQKIKNIMTKAVLAVFTTLIAASCLVEKEQMPVSMQSVMIQLNVSAGQKTKATEAVTEAEGKINTLRIFAFDGNRLAGHFFRAQPSTDPVFMDMLIPAAGSVDLDFYVIANEQAMRLRTNSPSISASMTRDQFAEISFEATHNMETYGLPMSAMVNKTVDAAEVAAQLNSMTGHQQHMILEDKVEVHLSKPLAKISLYAAKKEQSSTLVINDVTMLAGGTRQYAYLYQQADASKVEAIPSRANDRNLFSGSKTVQSYFTSASDKEDESKYEAIFTDAYLPEVPFDGGDLKSVILNIAHSGGFASSATNSIVEMPKIDRDAHYKIFCSFSANGKITVDFIVADWEDATMWQGGLVFDHPTHSFLLPSASSTHHSETPAQMTYIAGDDSGAFVGYFQMAYPANQTWTPTIFDGIAGDCRVEVWTVDGTDPITDPQQWVSGDKWYMIKVIPENPSAAGQKVKLAITYNPIWSDQIEFLMINGSQSDFVWPYTSIGSEDIFKADPNYVVITQK